MAKVELKITKENIESIPFDEYYNSIVKDPIIINDIESKYKNDDINNFFKKPSLNHYRLLSYLSTLFNNSLIIKKIITRESLAPLRFRNKISSLPGFIER